MPEVANIYCSKLKLLASQEFSMDVSAACIQVIQCPHGPALATKWIKGELAGYSKLTYHPDRDVNELLAEECARCQILCKSKSVDTNHTIAVPNYRIYSKYSIYAGKWGFPSV